MTDEENPSEPAATSEIALPGLATLPESSVGETGNGDDNGNNDNSFARTVAPERILWNPEDALVLNQALGNRDPWGEETTCWEKFCEKFGRLCNIILYPFMILFTMLSLIMIVTFCLLPTVCFLTCGICAYYCFMEDPIPLHLLLRYMFSADDTADNPFASGATSSYPPRADRGAIQGKLIIRRLTQIVDCEEDNKDENELVKEAKKEATKKHPRKYPHPIWVATESKCMKFSEPIVVEETSKGEEEEDGKPKKRRRLNEVDDARDDENNGEDDNSIASDYVPHYQRLSVPELSDRNLQETDVPQVLPVERSTSRSEIMLGDDTLSPQMTTESDSEGDGSNEDPEAQNEELEEVPIAVSEELNGEESIDETADEASADSNEDEKQDKEDEDPEAQICMECSGDDDDNDFEKDGCPKMPTKKPFTKEQSMAVSETPSQKLEADYFGIESDVRDRHTACDICLLEYEVGDEVAWSPNPKCTHTYHKDCVLDWLVRKPTCPNCRHDFTKGKKDN